MLYIAMYNVLCFAYVANNVIFSKNDEALIDSDGSVRHLSCGTEKGKQKAKNITRDPRMEVEGCKVSEKFRVIPNF